MGLGRLMPRSFHRLLRDTAGTWIILFATFFFCYTISSLIIQSYGPIENSRYYINSQSSDFAETYDQLELHRATVKRIWPYLRGYTDVASTEKTHPNDSLLLHRIEISQRNIRTPLFKIKKDGMAQDRHPWKFEKIIHQTWKTEEIPGQTAGWVKKWLEIHPDWTYMFWTDANSREFVQQYYPALLPVYDSWNIPVQRADMIRLLVLYTFGGVYADMDMEPLRPLDEVRDWSSCVLSREPDLQSWVMVDNLNVWANNWTFSCNAFMACRSHHPFLHYLIGRITYRSPLVAKRKCPLEETILCSGPVLVSLAYGFYHRSISEDIKNLRPETNVLCPRYEYFLPTFDETRKDLVREQCEKLGLSKKRKEVCEVWKQRGMKNVPLEYSFTTHHWFHSYHYNVSESHVNIRDVTSAIMWNPHEEEEMFEISFAGL